MHKLGKIAAIGALLTGLLGASLAVAPAANAATVNPSWKLQGTRQMTLNGATANVITTVANSKLVKPSGYNQWAYSSYRIVVKSASGKVYLNEKYAPTRAHFVKMALTSGKIIPTTATFSYSTKPSFSTSSLNSFKKIADKLTIAQIKAKDKGYNKEYNLEDEVLYSTVGDLYDNIRSWSKNHRGETTFANYTKATSGTSQGYRYKISGNPQDVFTVTGYVHTTDSITVSLVNKKVQGEYTPVPKASSDSLSALGYWQWVKNH